MSLCDYCNNDTAFKTDGSSRNICMKCHNKHNSFTFKHAERRPHVNAPCTCQSGKKYKKCCGAKLLNPPPPSRSGITSAPNFQNISDKNKFAATSALLATIIAAGGGLDAGTNYSDKR